MREKIFIQILFLLFLTSGLCACSNKQENIMEYLSLGQKYLLEEDYEQAIVALEKVIEIDENCVEAYLGLADAFYGIKDYAQAAEVLEEGYLITQDARLTEKKTMLEDNTEGVEKEPFSEDAEEEQLSPLIEVCENFDSSAIEKAILSDDIRTLWEQTDKYTKVSLENGKTLVLWSEGDDEVRDICLFYGKENEKGFQIHIFTYFGEVNGMELYEGCWTQGIPNGEGTVTVRLEDGISNRYHGTLLDGKWDGTVKEESNEDIDFPGCTYQFTDGILNISDRYMEINGVEYCVVSIMDDGEERTLPAEYVDQFIGSTWGVTGFADQGGALE